MLLLYYDLLNTCLRDNLFCINTSGSVYIQYINFYFIGPLKSCLTTFSNIAYASFILNRYFKVSDSKNGYLKIFSKKFRYWIERLQSQ